METVEAAGQTVACDAFELDMDTPTDILRDRMEKAHRSTDQTDMQVLDGMTRDRVTKFNSAING